MTSTLHDRTIRYLTATGWVPPEKVGELGGLWRHPDSQLLLPVPNDLTTAGVDWQLILERISAVEGVTVEDVSRTIEQQAVDVANLRAANDIVIRDSIPYWAGRPSACRQTRDVLHRMSRACAMHPCPHPRSGASMSRIVNRVSALRRPEAGARLGHDLRKFADGISGKPYVWGQGQDWPEDENTPSVMNVAWNANVQLDPLPRVPWWRPRRRTAVEAEYGMAMKYRQGTLMHMIHMELARLIARGVL